MSAAPAIQIDKEAIRILVADIGYTQASIRTGIKRDTLYKWGQRKGWKEPVVHAQAITVQSVQSPANVHAEALRDLEGQTRMSLARYASNAARESESAGTKAAPLVHKVAQIASITHKWGDQEKRGDTFTLNVLNLNSIPTDEE